VSKELETLFPDRDVFGVTIRPWTLGQIAKCAPAIAGLLEQANAQKLDIAKTFNGGDWSQIALLLAKCPDHVLKLVEVSTNLQPETVADLDLPKAIRILQAMFEANADYIKNSLARPDQRPNPARAI